MPREKRSSLLAGTSTPAIPEYEKDLYSARKGNKTDAPIQSRLGSDLLGNASSLRSGKTRKLRFRATNGGYRGKILRGPEHAGGGCTFLKRDYLGGSRKKKLPILEEAKDSDPSLKRGRDSNRG